MRFKKCPSCRKRCGWKYKRPILFAGVLIPVITCKNADPDKVSFSMGQPGLSSWKK